MLSALVDMFRSRHYLDVATRVRELGGDLRAARYRTRRRTVPDRGSALVSTAQDGRRS